MAVDLDEIIAQGRIIIEETSAIVTLVKTAKSKIAGRIDLTPSQIQELKNEAIVHKGVYLAARTAFEAAFTA